MKSNRSSRPVGRPRSFDPERALDRGLQVFWRKGYEGATLSDLTKAMGINRPSLYAAFGDKESLFRRALDRYNAGPASYVHEALCAKTAREVVQGLLSRTADLLTDRRHPPGCLFVQGALACGNESDAIRQELISCRAQGEAEIRCRLQRAKSEGDLPADSSPADLARFISTVIQGMAVQAAGGATRRQLRRVIHTALAAWPK